MLVQSLTDFTKKMIALSFFFLPLLFTINRKRPKSLLGQALDIDAVQELYIVISLV